MGVDTEAGAGREWNVTATPTLIAVGQAVRLKPANPRSDLAGQVGTVVETTHFFAAVSLRAALAQIRVDPGVPATPDIPEEFWALVELADVPLLPSKPRFSARLRVFLPVGEMVVVNGKGGVL
jgi:hypothetical protein